MITHQIHIDSRRLQEIIRQTPGIINQRLGRAAFDLEGDIKRSFNAISPSPVGEPPGVVTGFLRSSIYSSSVNELTWGVFAGAEYAIDLEYGTRKMGARPFMRPAADRLRRRINTFFEDLYD